MKQSNNTRGRLGSGGITQSDGLFARALRGNPNVATSLTNKAWTDRGYWMGALQVLKLAATCKLKTRLGLPEPLVVFVKLIRAT